MLTKLFKYELKRLLLNKFFLGLLIISALYSRHIMWGEIILGVANTAPFSGWSYGAYLAKVLPILLVALLFFISIYYSQQEKNVQALTKATPMEPVRFQMLRYGTIIIVFVLLSAVPIATTLLPAMLFVFGAGMLGGRYYRAIIFVLMVVVILVNYLPLPYAFDLLGENFFKHYPESLGVIEPAFTIPLTVLIGKSIYGLAGLAMPLMASRKGVH